MQKTYEVPELTLMGQAGEVVMGSGCCGSDGPMHAASDFEFEQD